MATSEFFQRLAWRRTPQQVVDIVADLVPTEPPTHQEVIDQLDADVVRQFQHMLDVEGG